MILLIILALIAIILAVACVVVFSVLGAGAILIAGDWIIAIVIIGFIIYKLISRLF